MTETGLAIFVLVSFLLPIPILAWLDRSNGAGGRSWLPVLLASFPDRPFVWRSRICRSRCHILCCICSIPHGSRHYDRSRPNNSIQLAVRFAPQLMPRALSIKG